MSERALSPLPEFGPPLSRRELASLKEQEAAFHAEVKAFMDKGLSFDAAWVAAGGLIFKEQSEGVAA